MTELPKSYNPKEFETRIYKRWEQSGVFAPSGSGTPFTIVMPPPNITGQLHMGHALNNSLQDILTRYHRMRGDDTLWLPGTDHASIATEAKVVEALKAQGISKDDLGRNAFIDRVWDWKHEYGNRITTQLRSIGSSCDWSRERFTMDEGLNKAVGEVFETLYKKGLIYRDKRLINWCPVCGTSISDAEVEYAEDAGFFWHLKYPLSDGSGFLNLATTRPETMLGDTAVAVNPDDERYKHLVGKSLLLPLCGREIPIVADNYVDKDFGTGVVKITPAHDPNDWAVGERHNLPVLTVFTEDGKINENGGTYAGLTIKAARKKIVADLDAGGFLKKIEPHTHNVGHCYRCDTVVEPMVSLQWFVKMESLARPAIDAVRNGKIKFVPSRFDKIYFNWMENIRDWCISRQLWWGHRIPAYYCSDCSHITVSASVASRCEKCQSTNIKQDEDTLDTWFSSALWPFSTLGWPEKTNDLKKYYPTSVLVTGWDIIFFWVARMIFSGIEYMDEPPFHTVFINGIIRDGEGKKMSKSAGNGVDPLEIIEKHGADALRFALVNGTSPGADMRYSEDKIVAARNFANKLYNASRFVLGNIDGTEIAQIGQLDIEDKWLLHQYNNLVKQVRSSLDAYEIGIASGKIYDFIWDVLCDWYIELSKTNVAAKLPILLSVLSGVLKLLHPFMPFITAEIYDALPTTSGDIITAEFPEYDESLNFEADCAAFDKVIAVIRGVRGVRAEYDTPPKQKLAVVVKTDQTELFRNAEAFITRLCGIDNIAFGDSTEEKVIVVATSDATVFIKANELVNTEKETARLQAEIKAAQGEIDSVSAKLGNAAFCEKAPAHVVDGMKERLEQAQSKLKNATDALALV
jgi:valyl-tRNA synthetase